MEAEKRAAEEPDEDGWVLVTKTGKNKGAPRTQVIEETTPMAAPSGVGNKANVKQKDKVGCNMSLCLASQVACPNPTSAS